MEDEVEFELVPDDGTLISDELLLDIVVFDYAIWNPCLPVITKEEFRGSQALLTSENSSKPAIHRLLSETLIPPIYYCNGIESDMVEKIQNMVLKSLHRNGTDSEEEKTARSIVEDVMLRSLHRNCNIVGHHMSIHIMIFDYCCEYYLINAVGVASETDLTKCRLHMDGFAECTPLSLAKRPKKRRKIQSGERSRLECSICLQEIMSNKAARLPCSHIYHLTCILKWLRISCVCPLCRCRSRAY